MYKYNINWKILSFEAEQQAALNVIGGNIDCAFVNPTMIYEHVRAGNLRVVLSGSPKRYKNFPDAPTIEELGFGKALPAYRHIFGPPDMPEYARTGALGYALDDPAFARRIASFEDDDDARIFGHRPRLQPRQFDL